MYRQIEWESAFRAMPAPCLVMDWDMRIVAATDLYLQTVGRRIEEIRGRYIFEAFPETGERLAMFESAFRRALSGEANTLVEVPYAIPVVGDDGVPTGQMNEIWWTCQHSPIFEHDGTVKFMVQNAKDVTQQVMAERLKDAVVNELQHRVGNIFALVASTACKTAANADTLSDFLTKFDGRLKALARTHTYLTGDNWDGITIARIVGRELADHDDTGGARVTQSGDNIIVNATEAQILTLAVHELTTNSVKYGALRSPEGRLSITWHAAGDAGFTFEWHEDGVARPVAPARTGFGSFILDTVVPAQLRATAERRFTGDAFVYTLDVRARATAHG
ncbi:sensor histidine kinase [Loktanella fryxellensis]|nr:PAS domain-containing sensor histidine kinase [Loktanella fryxellensis]